MKRNQLKQYTVSSKIISSWPVDLDRAGRGSERSARVRLITGQASLASSVFVSGEVRSYRQNTVSAEP